MSHEPQIRKLRLEWSTTCHEANVRYRVQSLVIEGRNTSESLFCVPLLVWKYIELPTLVWDSVCTFGETTVREYLLEMLLI